MKYSFNEDFTDIIRVHVDFESLEYVRVIDELHKIHCDRMDEINFMRKQQFKPHNIPHLKTMMEAIDKKFKDNFKFVMDTHKNELENFLIYAQEFPKINMS